MAQTINTVYLKITTTGSAGSATGTATTTVPEGISGFLYSIVVKPNATGWAVTTDIIVTEVGGPGRTILTLTDKSSALASYPVREAEVGAAGTALTSTAPIALAGTQITVALAQANAQAPAIEVWLYLLR